MRNITLRHSCPLGGKNWHGNAQIPTISFAQFGGPLIGAPPSSLSYTLSWQASTFLLRETFSWQLKMNLRIPA
jgi:hypothetical protein